MNAKELTTLLGWTKNTPVVLKLSNLFSKEEWLAINEAGAERFFTEFTDEMITLTMLHQLSMLLKVSRQGVKIFASKQVVLNVTDDDNQISLQKAAFHIFKGSAQELKKNPVGLPITVINWFGQELVQILEATLRYGELDDLVLWLSEPETRAIFEGGTAAIQQTNLPRETKTQLKDRDARALLRNGTLLPKDFFSAVKALAGKTHRALPMWVGEMEQNKTLASAFNDEELEKIFERLNQEKLILNDITLNVLLRLISSTLENTLSANSQGNINFDAVLNEAMYQYHLIPQTEIISAVPVVLDAMNKDANDAAESSSKDEAVNEHEMVTNLSSQQTSTAPAVDTPLPSSPIVTEPAVETDLLPPEGLETETKAEAEAEAEPLSTLRRRERAASRLMTAQAQEEARTQSNSPQQAANISMGQKICFGLALVMTMRAYVAWHATGSNNSFTFKCLEFMLGLSRQHSPITEIIKSAGMGAGFVFFGSLLGVTNEKKLNETQPIAMP